MQQHPGIGVGALSPRCMYTCSFPTYISKYRYLLLSNGRRMAIHQNSAAHGFRWPLDGHREVLVVAPGDGECLLDTGHVDQYHLGKAQGLSGRKHAWNRYGVATLGHTVHEGSSVYYSTYQHHLNLSMDHISSQMNRKMQCSTSHTLTIGSTLILSYAPRGIPGDYPEVGIK